MDAMDRLLVLRMLYASLSLALCVCFCVDVKHIANDIPLRDISLRVHLYAPYTREYYIIYAPKIERIYLAVLHPASGLDYHYCVRACCAIFSFFVFSF